MINFCGVRFDLAGTPLTVAPEDLERVEQQLACTFPDDYRKFVLTYGAGEFDELCFKVLPPFVVARDTGKNQSRLKEYWFWDESPDVWTKAKAVESIACFDGEGDDIRFHPSDPSRICFLSRNENVIYQCRGLAELLELTRKYYEPISDVLIFCPWGAAPGAAPNCGPATPSERSAVEAGPQSVT